MIQLTELDAKYRGLQCIEAAVITQKDMIVLLTLPVVSQHAHLAGDFFVIGDENAGIPERAKILRGVKAEASDVSQRTGAPAVVTSAVRLTCILYNQKAVFPGDGRNLLHVSGLA